MHFHFFQKSSLVGFVHSMIFSPAIISPPPAITLVEYVYNKHSTNLYMLERKLEMKIQARNSFCYSLSVGHK